MTIEVGDRVEVSGGYDMDPRWLAGAVAPPVGTVMKWIPGQNDERACVVHLDEPLTAEGLISGKRVSVTGGFLVLEVRYAGHSWEDSGTVHVELCSTEPEDSAWPDRSIGAWVESHATYTKRSQAAVAGPSS